MILPQRHYKFVTACYRNKFMGWIVVKVVNICRLKLKA